ncbi:MAG TPA: recombinase family protein [bacterium]|nr:recombinase family protein [bacterium]
MGPIEQDGKTRVGIYCRVSTEEQKNTGVSLALQESRLREYAKIREWRIVKVYTDAGVSAKTTRRDALDQLREDVRARKINAVLVFKIDRLSRSLYDLLTLIREFQKRKVALVSLTESFDTDSPMGAAMVSMLGTFAEFEQRQVSARTTDALAKLREEGRVYGPTPFGFSRDGKRLKPNLRQLEIVRRIYTMRARGTSLRGIAAALNADRIRTQTGRRWAVRQIQYITKNTRLYGPHMETDQGKDKRAGR